MSLRAAPDAALPSDVDDEDDEDDDVDEDEDEDEDDEDGMGCEEDIIGWVGDIMGCD